MNLRIFCIQTDRIKLIWLNLGKGIRAKYPGEKNFMVTVREKLSDSSLKECIFYAGTTEFEKVEFASGEGEAKCKQ